MMFTLNILNLKELEINVLYSSVIP